MLCASLVRGPIVQSGWVVDSQLSLHTLIVHPFPTTHPSPFFRMSRPARIPLQPWDAEFGAEQSRIPSERQYLLRKVLPSKEEGYFSRRQACFANKASLNTSISLKPRPLAPLGRVSLSHDTQHIFHSSGFMSHQNRVRTD